MSYALSKIGILTPQILKKFRRHAMVLNLVLAAFLTPPDPVSQIMIAIPLTILYEFSIWVSRIAVKFRERELNKAFGEVEKS